MTELILITHSGEGVSLGFFETQESARGRFWVLLSEEEDERQGPCSIRGYQLRTPPGPDATTLEHYIIPAPPE